MGKKSGFKSNIVWYDFKESHPRVQWSNLVWFSNTIPKHSFILWLAVRGKLLTQDRMQSWQREGISSCGFCKKQPDSLNHLFFDCFFSQEIRDFFVRLGVLIPSHYSWNDLVDFASQNWKGKSLVNVINKLVLGSLVYYIWQERNLRIFQDQHRSSGQVIKCIVEVVRLKIMGFKIRRSSRVDATLRLWNISWDTNISNNIFHGLELLSGN